MGTVLIASFLVYVAYMTFVLTVFGELASVSDSYYFLEERWGAGYAFTAWCALTGISVASLMFAFSDGAWYQFFGLFAGGGLLFVGSAPLFKSHERTIHIVSAAVCAIAALAWTVSAGYGFVVALILLGGVGTAYVFGNVVFRMENACFASVYAVLYLLLISQYIK
jgi:hypothetical protein